MDQENPQIPVEQGQIGTIQDQEISLDVRAAKALGIYVYALIDPSDNTIFYIGKGGGSDKGNARVGSHLVEASRVRKERFNEAFPVLSNKARLSKKVKRILAIWEAKREVDWIILRRKIPDEKEALRLEGAIIALLSHMDKEKLTNALSGHHKSTEGLLTQQAVIALNAPTFDPSILPVVARERHIFVFNIANGLKGSMNPSDEVVKQATERAWRIGQKFRNAGPSYAVGVVEGVSYGAYEIDQWVPDREWQNKYAFKTLEIQADVKDALINRNFRDILKDFSSWNYGGFGAFKITSIGDVEITRGVRSDAL